MTGMERMQTFAPSTSLRKEPEESAEVVTVLPRDTVLEVFEAAGRFSRVRCMGEGGQVLNGYIIANMLGPVVERNEVQAVPEKPGTTSRFTLIRSTLSGANSLLAAGLVILLITNLVTTFILWRNIRELQNRSVHVSCSGSSLEPSWGRYEISGVDPDYYQDGKVRFSIGYQVVEKFPGSKLVLRYRLKDGDVWNEQAMQESEKALTYVADFILSPDAWMAYQVVQRLNGENVRAERERYTSLAQTVGNGDVLLEFERTSGNSRLTFKQAPFPRVKALQFEQIVIEIDQKSPILRTLTNTSGHSHEASAFFEYDGFNSMTVRVRYRDGEERVAEFESEIPKQAVIKR